MSKSTLKPLPSRDAYRVAEQLVDAKRDEQQAAAISPEDDWTRRQITVPAEALPPTTASWMAGLPLEIRPIALGELLPRIANTLAALWPQPNEFVAYLFEMLADRHGRPKGFPIKILRELRALRAYYASIHPDRSDLWTKPKQLR